MIWKYSKLRFYILNTQWNYKFWLFAEKIFKEHFYDVDDEEYNLENLDVTGKMISKKTRVSRKRFIGYMHEGMLHLDNPGFKHTVDKDTWTAWKNKGLIK